MLKNKESLEKNINIIKDGRTSASFCSPFLFIKYIIRKQNYQVYEREKYLASILKRFDWYPKLLYSDDDNNFFIFSNAGIPITLENKPHDLAKQFNIILNDLKRVNVQHNDIKLTEILLDKNDKIHLCDFGWGSVNDDLGCGIGLWSCNKKDKPGGYHDDATTLKRLKLI